MTLLRDIDLHRRPRPEQLPHLRQRFDGRQESSLCPILPLLTPGIMLSDMARSPEVSLLHLKPTDGNALHQELFQRRWTRPAELHFEHLELLR